MLDPDLAWEEYKSLEEDFMKYLRFVPLTDEHDEVWSLYLGDLLIRIGSILDSFFRRAIFSPELDTATNIKKYRTLDDLRINMGTYREVFDPFYGLSSKKIYELRTFKSLTPFFSWLSSNKSPDWWKAYNNVKHDRFENKKEATLKLTLNALGGLFLLNVMHLETMPVLVDYNIIKSTYAKEFFKKLLLDREPLADMELVYAKTSLFGYVFKLKERSFDETEVKRILSRSYPGY